MKKRILVFFLALCFSVSILSVFAIADDEPFDPYSVTWTEYNAMSSSEKVAFYRLFPSSAAFNEWKRTAQEADKPETVEIGGGGTIVITPPHNHCVCGGGVTTGGHVHESGKNFTAITTDSVGELCQTFSDNVEHYYYLDGDVTVLESITVGSGATGAGVHLDLNGHTLTVTAPCLFSMNCGSASICDCKGTGRIIVNPAGYPASGTLASWEYAPFGSGASFNLYGGYVQNDAAATASSHGFFYLTCGGSLAIYGGTLDGNSKTSSVGGGLISAENDAGSINIYGGTLKNAYSGVAGGAIRADVPVLIDNYHVNMSGNGAPVGENVYSRISQESETTLVGEEIVAGTMIDLGGGTLRLTGSTVIDLAVSSSVDCGTLLFDDSFSSEDITSIVTSIAQNNLHMDKQSQCLPLKSGDRTYTVCKLNPAGGFWCPEVKSTQTSGTYKFRMMPRFASQTAYDILSATSPEDMLVIGFRISAKYNGDTVLLYGNGKYDSILNCDFTVENAQTFFAAEKDTQVFYVKIAGLQEGYRITVEPYIKLNGQIVYQGTSGTECAVLDLTT